MAIKIKKLSPSSINTFDGCQMKWFLSYVLGYREPSGKAAVKGTCAHYIMECLAKARLLQQAGRKWEKDNVVGRINAHHRGVNDIDLWIDNTFEHFAKQNSHLEWSSSDKKDIQKSVAKALEHDLSPLNHAEIISTEDRFSMPINEDWAQFAYEEDGEIKEGRLEINGVIDLVYRDDEGVINYLDYKFGGSLKDWNTGEEKTFESMMKDVQLCMYYWAIRQKYNDELDINSHIWYVNLKKKFSLFFDDTQIRIALNKVMNTFASIKSMEQPEQNFSWKCRFCEFSKTSYSDWGKSKLDVLYDINDNFSPVNGKKSMCDATAYFIKHKGINPVMENCKKYG